MVLAGGLARRMQNGGSSIDKGLVPFRGEPMIAHVLRRLAPQVGALLINANRNPGEYGSFGHPVVADAVGGFAGPLAGLHAGLEAATTEWVVTVPCDSPFLPADLVDRLFEAAQAAGADLAVARTGSQPHPVFALVRKSLLPSLEAFLSAGERKIDRWYAPLRTVEVDFPDEAAFSNINTQEELAALEIGVPGPARRSLETITREVEDFDPKALPVARAQAVMERFIEPIDQPEQVDLRHCLGRILARAVVSPIDVPAHDNSAMDGYAVRGADLQPDAPTRHAVVGTSLAGTPFDGVLGEGQAVRIMTGGVMPPGADTVVVQEVVHTVAATRPAEMPWVIIPPGQRTGQNRRLCGEDLARGKPALRAGKRLTPADVGLAASLGLPHLPLQRRPKVAFFSTGDELLSIGEPPRAGKVYDSNRYTIHAMLARLGVEPVDLGVVPDRPEALEQAMQEAGRSADAVISSGGVSVGEADFTREVMARVGEVAFWTVAMRPGRPMAFGRVGDAYYFGLPGNPVAVMVTFYFFVRPALERLMGAMPSPPATLQVRSLSAVRKKPGRTEYQRAVLSRDTAGIVQASITGSQGSGVLRSMSEADCMMVLGHDQGNLAVGDWVDVIPFHGLV
ncbi:MAG: molybdenum cofactor guanylyltransferase [Lautropia sp.]|nr:molybdenum cofactor guanylyltransferase [Lautropia sp.]